jgi:hypothetical protein
MFSAVGHNGLRMVSLDGIDWSNIQTGKEGETFRAVCAGNDLIVAVGSYGGSNLFSATRDGITWTHNSQDAQYSKYIRGIGFGNKQFLGLGGDPGSVGSSKPFTMTTKDGISWNDPHQVGGKNMLRRIAWGKNRFVAVGDRGRRTTSVDGITWSDAEEVKAIDTLIDIAYGAGLFVGVGLHGLRMTSADGLTWTDLQRGEEGEHLNSILWADDRFVAVGFGVTFSSTDGRTWKRLPNQSAPQTATFGNGIFVGASWRGRMFHSLDAVTWKPVFKAEQHVESLCYLSKSI